MLHIIDYIKENQDKSFKELKFNEIDALIFSLIPYLDLTKIASEKITIKNAYGKLNDKFPLKTKDKFTLQNKKMFELMASSKRYQNIILENFEKINSKTTQFGAITIRVPHEFVYIAFEGTDDLLVGWEEDFKISYEFPIEAQKHAYEYLKKVISFWDIVVYIGGHSKGGNLAIASLIKANSKARIRTKYIFNFDGPGFLDNELESKEYKRISKKIRTYYPEESVVGMILNNHGYKKIIKSDAKKVYQHNPHTWSVIKNFLEQGELSDYAKEMHKRLEKLITNYTLEQRKLFVKTIFNLLYKSGYTYKSELKKLNIINLKNMIKEATNLNEEEKKIVFEVIKVFILNDKE